MNNHIDPIILTGATGVGKTQLSIELAQILSGEIVSADSMQIYKKMDIGTAKITSTEMKGIPHHMIDIVDFNDTFSVSDFQNMALPIIFDIIARGKTPIITGGTGLYLDSLIYDLDFNNTNVNSKRRAELEQILKTEGKESINEIYLKLTKEENVNVDINNTRRVIRAIEVLENDKVKMNFKTDIKIRENIKFKKIVLQREREDLYNRINLRVDEIIQKGLIKEIEDLLLNGLLPTSQSMKAIGYRQIYEYLSGNITLLEAIELVKRDSRRYAKRQVTWFKKYKDANFIDITNLDINELLLKSLQCINLT